MRFKAYYLYIAGSVIALAFFIYELIVFHATLSTTDILISTTPVIILSYLAFKVHREQDDDELM